MHGLTETTGLSANTDQIVSLKKLAATGVTAANSTLVLPANAYIQRIIVKNNTANAITGGIAIGTTNGGADIMVALAVAGNALVTDIGTGLLKSIFSTSATQQIFLDAVVSWNSANVDVTIVYIQL